LERKLGRHSSVNGLSVSIVGRIQTKGRI
jgi:hypothetical protein